MSISDLISAIMWFGAQMTLYAFLTILIIFIAITVIKKNKGIIRWYLKLKSSNAPEVDKTIDKIFEREKLFDEFTKIWSGYKNATIFLSFQLVFLYLGSLWAILIILSQSLHNNISNWSYDIYLIIFFLIFVFTIYFILSPMILKTFKKSEKITKKSKLFLDSFLVFMTPILPYYILYYILINNSENNLKTWVAVYLILTIGMYETIKRILGFFLPTSPPGIYSTDELIQQISLALRGETNPLKEIVDQANDNDSTIALNSHKLNKQIMFDITDKETREQKLKFIEILLIVGGIIGGLRFQNKDDSMNIILGLFLTGSLLYYFTVSNTKINTHIVKKYSYSYISLIIGIFFTSICFSTIAVLPFISKGIFDFVISGALYGAFIIILWLALSITVFINLYS